MGNEATKKVNQESLMINSHSNLWYRQDTPLTPTTDIRYDRHRSLSDSFDDLRIGDIKVKSKHTDPDRPLKMTNALSVPHKKNKKHKKKKKKLKRKYIHKQAKSDNPFEGHIEYWENKNDITNHSSNDEDTKQDIKVKRVKHIDNLTVNVQNIKNNSNSVFKLDSKVIKKYLAPFLVIYERLCVMSVNKTFYLGLKNYGKSILYKNKYYKAEMQYICQLWLKKFVYCYRLKSNGVHTCLDLSIPSNIYGNDLSLFKYVLFNVDKLTQFWPKYQRNALTTRIALYSHKKKICYMEGIDFSNLNLLTNITDKNVIKYRMSIITNYFQYTTNIHNLTMINISNCNINDYAIGLLCNAIEKCNKCHIDEFDLSNNNIKDKYIEKLLYLVIHRCKNLIIFDISYNELSNLSCNYLVNIITKYILKTNKDISITYLQLSHNKLININGINKINTLLMDKKLIKYLKNLEINMRGYTKQYGSWDPRLLTK